MSEHDKQLIEQCKEITNPINWSLVSQLEDKAESNEVREFIHNWSIRLYRREEYDSGLL